MEDEKYKISESSNISINLCDVPWCQPNLFAFNFKNFSGKGLIEGNSYNPFQQEPLTETVIFNKSTLF